MNESLLPSVDIVFVAVFILLPIIAAVLILALAPKFVGVMRRMITNVGSKYGMTYWKGKGAERYSDSVILSRPTAQVFHALVSNEGIEMGIMFAGSETAQPKAVVAGTMSDYLCVRLPRKTGMYLFIDSTRNDEGGVAIRSIVHAHDRLQEFVLEGDFPANYKVYGAKGSQIETLQLLNPRAMAELIDNFRDYDIEIASDGAYLFNAGELDSLTNDANIQKRLEDGRRFRQFLVDHLPMQPSY